MTKSWTLILLVKFRSIGKSGRLPWHQVSRRCAPDDLSAHVLCLPGAMELILEEWEKITIEEINHEIVKLPDIMLQCITINGGNKFQA